MSQRTPSLCFHKPSRRFYVRLRGKPCYLGYDKSLAQTQADRLIGEWLAGGRNAPEPVPTHDLTIAELVNQYRHYAESYYRRPDGSPSGHLSVVKSAMRLLRQNYGATQAAAFGPLALRALRERMIEGGLSRSYINGQVHRVRLAFKWAVGRELLPIETFQRLLTVEGLRRGRNEARDPDPIRPVDDATVEATLVFLNPTLADMVRMQALTEMRPGEMLLMRTCDIDRSDDVWVFTPAHHKTQHHGHERRISIGPKCHTVLRKYILRACDPQ